ncbi:MAG TPA: hypothetical protein ENN08_00825 [Bacteroidales bacterium]|nr:hypothetical protein [Bacteroidales bacterium]
MKIRFFTAFLILLLPVGLMAQQPSSGSGPEALFKAHLSGEVYTPPVIHSGSQWFIGDWANSNVTLITGEKVSDVMLRYNGYLDELFWLTPGTFEQVRLDKNLIRQFEMEDPGSGEKLIFKNLEVNNILAPGSIQVFAQLLHRGDISLYVHRKIRETGATTSVMVGGTLVARRVLGPDYQYYLQHRSELPGAIQPARRSLMRTFPQHRRQIRQALRQHNIRIRNEAQLIYAIEIINDLVRNGK